MVPFWSVKAIMVDSFKANSISSNLFNASWMMSFPKFKMITSLYVINTMDNNYLHALKPRKFKQLKAFK